MSAKQPDFHFNFGDFGATVILVEALSEAGKALFGQMFGEGAVSVALPKSKSKDLALFVSQKGLTWD